MSATGWPISWAPRPASWRPPPSRASCRASGGLIIRAWCRASGSTRAASRRRAPRSIICCGRIRLMPRRSLPRAAQGVDLIEFLERRIMARVPHAGRAALLARDIHVLPEFLGNRSPYADPDSRAVIAGLDLDADIGAMERLFVAGLCGLAYGLADVIDAFSGQRGQQPRHGDGGRRIAQPAGAADHGRHHRARRWRCRRRRSRCCWARPCWARSRAAPIARSARPWPRCRRSAGSASRLIPSVAAFHRRKREIHQLLRDARSRQPRADARCAERGRRP